jgi:thioredoxin-related protein
MKYKVYLWIYKSNGCCYCREYKNIQGETHREDGPAIEYTKERLNFYFLNNRKYSEKEYWEIINETQS